MLPVSRLGQSILWLFRERGPMGPHELLEVLLCNALEFKRFRTTLHTLMSEPHIIINLITLSSPFHIKNITINLLIMLLSSFHVTWLTQEWWYELQALYVGSNPPLTTMQAGGTKPLKSHIKLHMGHYGSNPIWSWCHTHTRRILLDMTIDNIII